MRPTGRPSNAEEADWVTECRHTHRRQSLLGQNLSIGLVVLLDPVIFVPDAVADIAEYGTDQKSKVRKTTDAQAPPVRLRVDDGEYLEPRIQNRVDKTLTLPLALGTAAKSN